MDRAGLARTSVPRWPAPVLPPAGSYLACWFGDEASLPVQALLAGAEPGVPAATAALPRRWDDAVEAELRRLVGACRMGVRIIVAGPEALVLRSLSLARELGASDEELFPIATEAVTARRVYCAPCALAFDAVAAIGGTVAIGQAVACPGCAAELTVDHRFSRSLAAYFGWPGGLDPHQ